MNIRIYYEQSKCDKRVFSIKRKAVRNLIDINHSLSKINAFGIAYIEVIQPLLRISRAIHLQINKLSQKDDNSMIIISLGFHCLQRSCSRSAALSGIQTLILHSFYNIPLFSKAKLPTQKGLENFSCTQSYLEKKNQLTNPRNELFNGKIRIYLTCSKYASNCYLFFQIPGSPSLPSFPIPASCLRVLEEASK